MIEPDRVLPVPDRYEVAATHVAMRDWKFQEIYLPDDPSMYWLVDSPVLGRYMIAQWGEDIAIRDIIEWEFS